MSAKALVNHVSTNLLPLDRFGVAAKLARYIGEGECFLVNHGTDSVSSSDFINVLTVGYGLNNLSLVCI